MADTMYHANEGVFTLASETMYDNLVGGTLVFSGAEIDGAAQGDSFTFTDIGLKSCVQNLTFFLDEDEEPPAIGDNGAASTRFKDATTDGVVTGNFVVTNVSLVYRLNGYAAFDVTLKNQGAYTITKPIT